uniref:Uncharacterized protein n=1 Tax=Curvibacter symbiont subsp. Hydra magnipapillata TaxID=667019 RepID=C9YDX5_CURXX|nr:hypothetical protein Csp_D27810 [Curvibacter putative symbiont of Hydra magnipapillata]
MFRKLELLQQSGEALAKKTDEKSGFLRVTVVDVQQGL